MSRDRLADLQRVRASAPGVSHELHSEDERGLARFGSSFGTFEGHAIIRIDEDGGSSLGSLSQIEDLKRCITEIGDEVEKVKKLQSEILSSPVPDKKTEELDQLMSTIKHLSNGVRAKLKEMESALKHEEEEATRKDPTGVVYINADMRMRKTQYSALSRQFLDTMTIYQTAQADHRDRCKGRIKRHLDIVGSDLSDDEVEKMMEEGNWSVFTSEVLQETEEARKTLADVQARYNDMIKLEKSIRELHDMFLEMALLIETQGELIDRIESNVANTQDYVESGTQKFKDALKIQRNTRKKKLGIIIIVVAITLIIGVIIYFSAK